LQRSTADGAEGGLNVVVVQAAGEEDGDGGGLDDSCGEGPVVGSGGAAESAMAGAGLAGVEEEGLYVWCGECGFPEGEFVLDLEDLHEFDVGAGSPEVGIGAGGVVWEVAELKGVAPGGSEAIVNGVWLVAGGEEKGGDGGWDGAANFGVEWVWDRAGAGGHVGDKCQGVGAVGDGEGGFGGGFDAADHESGAWSHGGV